MVRNRVETTITLNTALAGLAIFLNIITILGIVFVGATRLANIEMRGEGNKERLGLMEGRLTNVCNESARNTVKVEAVWGMLMRRAVAEAVNEGLADMNSPLAFKPKAIEALLPLKERLTDWAQRRKHLNQRDFLLALESDFGDALLTSFCIPLRVEYGSCLLAAMQVALNVPRLDLDLALPESERMLFDPALVSERQNTG